MAIDKTNRELVSELLEKPMERKQFLKHLGVGAMGIIGVTGIIETILGNDNKPKEEAAKAGRPYGTGRYGR